MAATFSRCACPFVLCLPFYGGPDGETQVSPEWKLPRYANLSGPPPPQGWRWHQPTGGPQQPPTSPFITAPCRAAYRRRGRGQYCALLMARWSPSMATPPCAAPAIDPHQRLRGARSSAIRPVQQFHYRQGNACDAAYLHAKDAAATSASARWTACIVSSDSDYTRPGHPHPRSRLAGPWCLGRRGRGQELYRGPPFHQVPERRGSLSFFLRARRARRIAKCAASGGTGRPPLRKMRGVL